MADFRSDCENQINNIRLDDFIFRCSGNVALAGELIDIFEEGLGKYRQDLMEGVSTLGGRELRVIFHSLRNEVDPFGVEVLSKEMRQLESHQDDESFRQELRPKLEDIFYLLECLRVKLKKEFAELNG